MARVHPTFTRTQQTDFRLIYVCRTCGQTHEGNPGKCMGDNCRSRRFIRLSADDPDHELPLTGSDCSRPVIIVKKKIGNGEGSDLFKPGDAIPRDQITQMTDQCLLLNGGISVPWDDVEIS